MKGRSRRDELEMQDRRGSRRYAVHGLGGNLNVAPDASIVNVSIGGMEVSSGAWLGVGRSYRIRLTHGEVTMALTGTVVWCKLVRGDQKEQGAHPVYRAGIRFDDPGDRTQVLAGFLVDTAVVEPERRLAGRFRVRRETAVNVSFEREFRVASLSRSELTLDADLLLEVGTRYDLEFAGNAEEGPIPASVEVTGMRRLPQRDGEPMFRFHARLLDLAPEAYTALDRLIRREVAYGTFLGNESTSIFHRADCRHANSAGLHFTSRKVAVAAGFRPGGCCEP